jgi:hypothetical protein
MQTLPPRTGARILITRYPEAKMSPARPAIPESGGEPLVSQRGEGTAPLVCWNEGSVQQLSESWRLGRREGKPSEARAK